LYFGNVEAGFQVDAEGAVAEHYYQPSIRD
jgi:hypothetical protein